MATDYNRLDGVFDTESKRNTLINAMFPQGFPIETVPLTFSANNIVANYIPNVPLNKSLLGPGSNKDMTHKFGWRYIHPTSGTNRNKVLILIHGHDGNNFDDAYPASIAAGGKMTHGIRVQLHGLPSNVTNANWKVPVTSGIPIIEMSLWGQYLNRYAGIYLNDITEHNRFCSELGSVSIGMFMWPIIVAINTVVAAGKTPILAGFSGGGWAAMLAAAIDPRVRLSFCQSGHTGLLSVGQVGTGGASADGEQNNAEFYSLVNLHELMIMGTDATGRKATHVWNTNGDTVFNVSAAQIRSLNSGGLPGLASRYGGELKFLGFDGLNDPCTNFGGGAGTATYTSIATSVASCLNAAGSASGADPGAFSFSHGGHHFMNQFADYVVTNINSL